MMVIFMDTILHLYGIMYHYIIVHFSVNLLIGFWYIKRFNDVRVDIQYDWLVDWFNATFNNISVIS